MNVEFHPLLFRSLAQGSNTLRAPSFEQTILVNKDGFDPDSLVELQFTLDNHRARIVMGGTALLQVNNVSFKPFESLDTTNNAFVEPVESVDLQRDGEGWWLPENSDVIENPETFDRFIHLINEHAPHESSKNR